MYPEDAKIAKPEVNLMSLLSTVEGISGLQLEEKEKDKESEDAPKLPRTNSLEDLGIKVHLLFQISGKMLFFRLYSLK